MTLADLESRWFSKQSTLKLRRSSRAYLQKISWWHVVNRVLCDHRTSHVVVKQCSLLRREMSWVELSGDGAGMSSTVQKCFISNITAWWFGTWIYSSIFIGNVIIPADFDIFQRDRLKTPTRSVHRYSLFPRPSFQGPIYCLWNWSWSRSPHCLLMVVKPLYGSWWLMLINGD